MSSQSPGNTSRIDPVGAQVQALVWWKMRAQRRGLAIAERIHKMKRLGHGGGLSSWLSA